MTTRDKDKIQILISEAIVEADSHKEVLYGKQYDEERVFNYVELPRVKMILEQLRYKLLKDDDPNEDPSKPRICPVCGSRKVEPVVKSGSWGYYPASAHIECMECGARSREFDGKDDCDKQGAILKATKAWNSGRID